jgi:hypothetical protein
VCVSNQRGPAPRPVIAEFRKSETKTNVDANQLKGQSALLTMSPTSPSMAERNDEQITNPAFTGHAAPDHTSLESPLESVADKPADEGPELTFLTTLQVLGGFMCLFNSYV